jgi:hypothetical protein
MCKVTFVIVRETVGCLSQQPWGVCRINWPTCWAVRADPLGIKQPSYNRKYWILIFDIFSSTCGINSQGNKNTFSVSCKEKSQRDICNFCPDFNENLKISKDFGKSLKHEISRHCFIWVSWQVSVVLRMRLMKLQTTSNNLQRAENYYSRFNLLHSPFKN